MLDRIVRRRITRMFLAVVACGAVAALSATPATHAGPADSKSELPVDRGVMQRVADFTLKDVATDRPVSLYSFVGKKAIVLVFLGTDCPVGNLYVPRLIELNQRVPQARASSSWRSIPTRTRPRSRSPSSSGRPASTSPS